MSAGHVLSLAAALGLITTLPAPRRWAAPAKSATAAPSSDLFGNYSYTHAEKTSLHN
jgi:hypothetical protein